MDISNISQGVKCILNIYRQVTEEQRKLGLEAYSNYHEELKRVSKFFGYDFENVVAAFAALSPGNKLEQNFKDLIRLIEGVKAGKTCDEIRLNCYPQCTERGYLYLEGHLKVKKPNKHGYKTFNFYNNILYPFSPDYVTIDRHAIRIWNYNQVDIDFEKKVFSSKLKYKLLAADYMTAAKLAGILPCEIQAITWYVKREEKERRIK